MFTYVRGREFVFSLARAGHGRDDAAAQKFFQQRRGRRGRETKPADCVAPAKDLAMAKGLEQSLGV